MYIGRKGLVPHTSMRRRHNRNLSKTQKHGRGTLYKWTINVQKRCSVPLVMGKFKLKSQWILFHKHRLTKKNNSGKITAWQDVELWEFKALPVGVQTDVTTLGRNLARSSNIENEHATQPSNFTPISVYTTGEALVHVLKKIHSSTFCKSHKDNINNCGSSI